VLVVVDLDEGDAGIGGASGFFEVVGLVEAEEAVPEGEGSGKVGDEVAYVGDAGDVGAGWRLGVDWDDEKQGYSGEDADWCGAWQERNLSGCGRDARVAFAARL
jgi:hypothetical protein